LYSDPTQRDARLAPAYDIVNTTAYIPKDLLALDLVGNKSLFASRQGLLDFARVCDVAQPEEVIREQLQALEQVLARSTELCEQVPHVVAAIEHCAGRFIQTFG
jgi:serine/threonine-protein kinase HipA